MQNFKLTLETIDHLSKENFERNTKLKQMRTPHVAMFRKEKQLSRQSFNESKE